jgi:hypothetical protein
VEWRSWGRVAAYGVDELVGTFLDLLECSVHTANFLSYVVDTRNEKEFHVQKSTTTKAIWKLKIPSKVKTLSLAAIS